MTTFCMTEHIHRDRIDFYPGEEKSHTPASLEQLYDDFYHEARRLQQAYSDHIQLFVGFEGEWIRDSSLGIIERLLEKYRLDLFVGSIHHVHTLPIDYDTPSYHKAREISGGTDEQLFADYFDAQHAMLQALRPPVIGHFDLIRLKSDQPDRSFKTWPHIWDKITRNLKFVAEYGGVLELNSSSLRKGMKEAYPQVEICKVRHLSIQPGHMLMMKQEFKGMSGRFTLSDDSHGMDQVGLNYRRVLECIKEAGLSEVYCLAHATDVMPAHDRRFGEVGWRSISIAGLEDRGFWKR